MKKSTKKYFLCIILIMLSVISIANINSFSKENVNSAPIVETNSELSFSKNPVYVKVGESEYLSASIPVGYNNLVFELNNYCSVVNVIGNTIMVTGINPTDINGCRVKGTVSPIQFTKDLRDISAYLNVIVIK